MRDIYLKKAEDAERSAKVNRRFTWFYAVMVVINCGVGVWQLGADQPALSFIIAGVMVLMVAMNIGTVRRYEEAARGYRSLAGLAIY